MMDRAAVKRAIAYFETAVDIAVMAGAGHPGLVDWKNECLEWAREKLIRKMTGDTRPMPRRPAEPEVEW